jgi:predicted dehydrogenase
LYSDWRDLIARDDIDFVHVVTPPHWHALMVIAAAEAGKDIWCEKPFTRTIGEGIKAVEACRRNGTILRINTWGRAVNNNYLGVSGNMHCHDLRKLVNSGLLGTPLTAVIGAQFGHDMKVNQSHTVGHINDPVQSTPPELDYNMWLGSRPWKPYFPHRVHWNFRAYWDYDAGGLGDMGFHWLDPILYALGKDEEFAVKAVTADNNPEQHPDACLPWKRVEAEYADGTKIIFDDENREQYFLRSPDHWLRADWESDIPNLAAQVAEMPAISPGNQDFIACMKNREKFCLNEEVGHHSNTLMNLCVLALRLGRTINWDPQKNEVIGDDQANRLVWESMRAPWNLDDSSV